MRVDCIVSLACCNWDCRVSHLWRTTKTIRVLSRIWREIFWTTKDTSPLYITEGYSSMMVGDTQIDDPWLGTVPQIDDGPLWRCRGLSCWEIWWIKWSHRTFNLVAYFIGVTTQGWMGPRFYSHSGRNAKILVCGSRVAQNYHHLGGVVCLFCIDV